MYSHESLDHRPRAGNDLDWTPTHLILAVKYPILLSPQNRFFEVLQI